MQVVFEPAHVAQAAAHKTQVSTDKYVTEGQLLTQVDVDWSKYLGLAGVETQLVQIWG